MGPKSPQWITSVPSFLYMAIYSVLILLETEWVRSKNMFHSFGLLIESSSFYSKYTDLYPLLIVLIYSYINKAQQSENYLKITKNKSSNSNLKKLLHEPIRMFTSKMRTGRKKLEVGSGVSHDVPHAGTCGLK